ncbi:MAG TPA: hypothetical protein VD978_10380 [Azospirillum sp.]|nr:hypothetical protein [Azospirillum sp.]
MAVVYVARSATLSDWASDVGLGKHVYKVGVADDKEAAKAAISAGWAGETDWKALAMQEADITEDRALERLNRREKAVDPTYYPRIKGTPGLFRVTPAKVTNSLLIARSLETGPDAPLGEIKPKPKDFAEYLIRNAVE